MKNDTENIIDERIASRMPMWVRKRLVSIRLERCGRALHYTAEIKPFDFDNMKGNVVFNASCMKDFRHQIQLYRHGCFRCGIDYMMFR